MATRHHDAVNDFLAQQRIAVAGVAPAAGLVLSMATARRS